LALYAAFPRAMVGRDSHDYYGDSVAIGLAPLRQSRSTVVKDVLRMG